jgi:hypothetical protein
MFFCPFMMKPWGWQLFIEAYVGVFKLSEPSGNFTDHQI